MSEQPRWKYRFESFERAHRLLAQALDKGELNDLERSGLIHRFEFTYELAWKTLSDRLKYEGIDVVGTARAVIRQACAAGLIDDGDSWTDMLGDRNRMSHRYNLEDFVEVEENIRARHRVTLENFRKQFAQEVLDT